MILRRFLCFWITISFVVTLIIPPQKLYAQNILDLPVPGTMVSLSSSFEPALIRGLTVHQDNPFLFDFIVDPGQSNVSKEVLKDESDRMIKYFFASLTIPDKDIWVNLSPYEKDRMIPQSLGETAMGRDLLAQDYMLKQLTASLIYPQKALGKTFWAKVYAQAQAKYGTTQIPVNTFNKVWIVPQKAGVYEHGQTAYIVNAHLKVMLEEDYLSLTKHNAIANSSNVIASEAKQSQNQVNKLGSQIIRSIILPEIEKEINEGKNFATLRQIFYAQVLAVWFKRNLKRALLNRVYSNKGTVKGIDQNDTATNEAIYHQYLRAYKKGVFNFIKEDIDPVTQETLPRKYFSGGFGNLAQLSINEAMLTPTGAAADAQREVIETVLASYEPLIAKPIVAAKLIAQPTVQHNATMLTGIKSFVQKSLLALFLATVGNTAVGQTNSLAQWLRNDIYNDELGGKMPKSFEVPSDPIEKAKFWKFVGNNTVDGVVEKMLVNDGIEIYDGAVWQVALAIAGGEDNWKAAQVYTDTLNAGSFGELSSIRTAGNFTYQGQALDNGYFFRLIAPRYNQTNPETGAEEMPGFPEGGRIHWVDWMPVTGENAWVVIGQLQLANAIGHGIVNVNSPQIQLANSLVPAFDALSTPIGAVLYAPKGTFGHSEGELSAENNESLYAALTMLHDVTQNPQAKKIADGIESFFQKYAYDKVNHIFYQGGRIVNGHFTPSSVFATDVQTWGILSFSPKVIDSWYGEGVAYQIWKSTKERTGFYDADHRLAGVGFAAGHSVQSGEWSFGAIGAANELAVYYRNSHPDWSKECEADAVSMLQGVQALRHKSEKGLGILYANRRIAIPFGWNANAIPSLASTGWDYLIQRKINPFVLGGRTQWNTLPSFTATVNKLQNETANPTPAPTINPNNNQNAPSIVPVPRSVTPVFNPQSQNSNGTQGTLRVISGRPSGSYAAGNVYSVWKDFPDGIDFTTIKTLRITFTPSQAGVKIAIRLLPKGASPDSPTGLDDKAYTIPQNGIVDIPMSDFESLGDSLKNIVQASVGSGSNAWNVDLNDDPLKRVSFIKIEVEEVVSQKTNPPAKPSALTQPNVPSTTATVSSQEEAAANELINSSELKNGDHGFESSAYQELLAMKEKAVSAEIKALINPDSDLQLRKWLIQILSANVTPQTAPWIKWAFQQFARNAKDGGELWVRENILRPAMDGLGPVVAQKPPFINQSMINQINQQPDRAILAEKGGIDLSTQDGALLVTKDIQGGVKVNVDPALIARIEREGMSEVDPVIIGMRPADVQAIYGVGALISTP